MNMSATTHNPATVNKASAYNLTVRKPEFDFSGDSPEFWQAGDPFRTLLLAAMSGGFPEGERFFIDAVRQFQDQVTDPKLKQAIRLFIGQEAHHAKEHRALNGFLAERGYPIGEIEKLLSKGLAIYRKRFSPARQLAQTVALEHFTAIMAEGFMLDQAEIEQMDPRMAKLWVWHAVEESEHKAVAFDVFKATVDSEWIRISQMMYCTLMFMTMSSLNHMRLLKHSGHLYDLRMWARGLDHFWGRHGAFRKMIPAYLDFYRRDFHPNQHDYRAQIEAIKQRYLPEFA